MGKVLFSVCLSVHTSTGGGVPWSSLDGGGGGEIPWQGLDGEEPQPGFDGGRGYPSHVWMALGGGTLARSGWWGVPMVPPARSGWSGVPGVPSQLGLDGGGYPPP